ncbi:MAG: IclR family transcriptional regulator, partial [Acidimicrobiia bacterium]|nr:IclR family transcriptional regulator [Acidimicrobiia bacterium]
GARVRLHASAMGKAILAFSGADLDESVDSLGELVGFTTHTLVTKASLRADLELTRRRGYSVNGEERYAGVSAVAAPVLDEHGVARAAVGVQGPTARLAPAAVAQAAAQVVATSQAVGRLLSLESL